MEEIPEQKLQIQEVKPPKWRPSRKQLIIAAAVLALITVLGLLFFVFSHKSEAPGPESAEQSAEQPEEAPTNVRMLATGDWIAHDAINLEGKTDSGYSYASMTEPFKTYFEAADLNFCNQATLAGGESFGISGYPIFNAPFEWIHDMKGLGCNVINTGTNHTNDKGQGPITAQADEWDKQQILAHAGSNRSAEEQNKVRYFENNGIKFALLSYSTYSNTPNPNPYSLNRFTEPLVTTQMTEARAQADIVIVSMRWGTEYSSGINSAQEEAAQKLAGLGADIVLGHGPHVLEPVKRLSGLDGRETIVWFSLGNFLNAQLETEARTGCVATFTFDIASKKLTDSMCLPFYQHYEWTAEAKAAEKLLERDNFLIMPLYKADGYLAKSLLDTTVQAQMDRISGIVNTYTKIPVHNADDL